MNFWDGCVTQVDQRDDVLPRRQPAVIFRLSRPRSLEARLELFKRTLIRLYIKPHQHYKLMGFPWKEMTLARYKAIVSLPCAYCHTPTNPNSQQYHGIDRFDSTVGYLWGPLLPRLQFRKGY